MFASCSCFDRLGRKANKIGAACAPRPRPSEPDNPAREKCQRGYANWRFHPRCRKSCLGTKLSRPSWRVCHPDKAEARKGIRSLAVVTRAAKNGCRGGITRPSQRLTGCRCGYTSLNATSRRFWRVNLGTAPFGSPKKAGATSDPRHGCSVNTAESASRLNRFTDAPVGRGGLNGWGCCAR